MSAAGQGSISFSAPSVSGGGGGTVAGARNGTSLDTSSFVVLGNETTDLANPAALTDARRVPMAGFPVEWQLAGDAANNMSFNSGSAFIRFNADNAELFEIWQPLNSGVDYTPFGQGQNWYSGYDVYPGVNEPTTSRPNVVGMFWGYNVGFNQGKIDPTEAAFRFATETFFVIGTDPHFEFHIPEVINDLGIAHRVMSYYISRTGATGVGFGEQVIDDFTVYSAAFDPALGQYYFDYQYNDLDDTTTVQINSQLAGGVSKLEFGNWTDGIGSAFITWQSGQMTLATLVRIALSSVNIGIESSNFTSLIGQVVNSANPLASPNSDAIFDVQSTTQGVRVPSMTTAQRLTIPVIAGSGGVIVFDTTLDAFFGWNGTIWVAL